jgi:Divergent InlB B-repeat domain/Fibronectin type III domain
VLLKSSVSWFLLFSTLVLGLLGTHQPADAALPSLTLTWTDASNNEDGFRIERRTGTSGTYQQLASVAANTVSYTDQNLTNATTYCYRVLAYNSGGNSPYSNENCATTPAGTFALTVSRAGTGSGTITSAPAGISCGTDCSESYVANTVVTLSAVAATGSTFGGWSGNADCADGVVTVNASFSCTATFNPAPSGYTLTTSIVNEVTSSGTASGRIVSSPAGIDCGSDCTEIYTSGQVVTLTPVPGTNSKFSGWSGDADCTDGSVTLNASKTCTAKFSVNATTLTVAKKGKGLVKSTTSGIDCGTICSYPVFGGSAVSLRATPDAGYVFTGWSGGCSGTGDCTVTVSSSTVVTANFQNNLIDRIGVYRPSTGQWYLDRNGSGTWEGCSTDVCVDPFTGSTALPVVGDWDGSGTAKLGVFVSDSAQWLLDGNGNGTFDGCQIDVCIDSFGESSDLPVVGKWTTAPESGIGVFRPTEKRWHLDSNSNDTLDSCNADACVNFNSYQAGDIPVAGDWMGRGTAQLGLFRPSTRQWFLDRNNKKTWDGCGKDSCFYYGVAGDRPVVGDWNGTGISKIGVFRPSTGEWFLDLNGNNKWDGPSLDLYVPGFGMAGDIPVVGKW